MKKKNPNKMKVWTLLGRNLQDLMNYKPNYKNQKKKFKIYDTSFKRKQTKPSKKRKR